MPDQIIRRVDTDNQYTWDEIVSTYQEDGQFVSELIIYDSGFTRFRTPTTLLETNKDIANQYSWAEVSKLYHDTYDNDSIISELTTYDDGNTELLTYEGISVASKLEVDNADGFIWAERTTSYRSYSSNLVGELTTKYDNGIVSVETLDAQRNPTHTFVEDTLDATSWTSLTVRYNVTGYSDRETTIFDDGVRSEIEYFGGETSPRIPNSAQQYDDGEVYDWKLRNLAYDNDQNITNARIVYDNGLWEELRYYNSFVFFNLSDNGEINDQWDSISIKFDEESGEIISRITVLDDGERNEELVDATDPSTAIILTEAEQAAYDRLTTFMDTADPEVANNQLADEVFLSTEPLETIVQHDDEDRSSWSEIRTSYNADDEIVLRETIYDNGVVRADTFDHETRTKRTESDPDNVMTWEARETTYDSNGAIAERETVSDDSNVKREVFVDGARQSITQQDLGDTKTWDTMQITYDVEGRVASKQVAYDSGVVRNETFEGGVLVTRLDEDTRDAKSWEAIVSIYDPEAGTKTNTFIYDNGVERVDVFTDGKLVERTKLDTADAFIWNTIEVSNDIENGTSYQLTKYDNGDEVTMFSKDGERDLRVERDGDDSQAWGWRLTDYQSEGSAPIVLTFDLYSDLPAEYTDYIL